MSTLAKAVNTFQDLGRALGVVSGPSRDDLVAELDELRQHQPEYVNIHADLGPIDPHTTCAGCGEARQRAVERKAAYMARDARAATLAGMLFRKTFGATDEQDDLGAELAKLRGEIRAAINANDVQGQRWERRIEYDRRNRPIKAFATVPATVERGAALRTLMHQAQDVMPFLKTADLRQAIVDVQGRLADVKAMPAEKEVPLDAAVKAGPTLPRDSDTEAAGLIPGPRPGVLSGTTRMRRRD